jgi:hypothetical protein
MTLYQFNALDGTEKLEAVWEKGVKIAERQDAEFRYVLYQIAGFYVEEKIHLQHNVRFALVGFSSTSAALLKPYLDIIDIAGLTG